MGQAAPVMAHHVSRWMQYLSGTTQPENYFKHPQAFPSLLLPWWLEKSISDQTDLPFQATLVYSTINGYYAIRLIDNLMDDQATVELNLLPALNFFQTQFQAAYYPYFGADHPFWNAFNAIWFHSAEVTLQDATLTDLDACQFEQISAQKVCAAKIPLVAVCYQRQRPDLIEPWSRLVDLLGCWHQLINDLFGWHRDYACQIHTYFLAEAERRREADEPVAGWVAREGFDWAIGKSHGWMSALKALAGQLHSSELLTYLETREAMLIRQTQEVAAGLETISKIVAESRVAGGK
jgi:hypothetical protein